MMGKLIFLGIIIAAVEVYITMSLIIGSDRLKNDPIEEFKRTIMIVALCMGGLALGTCIVLLIQEII